MSCGATQQDQDENPQLPIEPTPSSVCIRCNKPATIVLRTTAYCSECCEFTLQTKFRRGMDGARIRSRMGTQREIDSGYKRGLKRSKVVLAFSGGPSSRALIDLVEQYFPAADDPSQSNPKYKPPPVFESLQVVYIDESAVPGFGEDRTAEVEAIVAQTRFKFVRLKMENLLDSNFSLRLNSHDLTASTSSRDSSDPALTASDRLRAYLSPSIHSPTAIASLHRSLIRRLLHSYAQSTQAELLLTGETATRVAVQTISGMAEGRGYSLGEEVGWEWEVDGGKDLRVVRPLSLMLAKEIIWYNRYKQLNSLVMIRPETLLEGKKAGIEALTEAFVLNLEEGFPSTVPTIIRTAQKLGMRSADDIERNVKGTPCPICSLPAQPGASEWRSSNTISSLADSRANPAKTLPPTQTSNAAENSAESDVPLIRLMCYSCLLIFQGAKVNSERDGKLVLPNGTEEIAKERWQRQASLSEGEGATQSEMQRVVSEYLIE